MGPKTSVHLQNSQLGTCRLVKFKGTFLKGIKTLGRGHHEGVELCPLPEPKADRPVEQSQEAQGHRVLCLKQELQKGTRTLGSDALKKMEQQDQGLYLAS